MAQSTTTVTPPNPTPPTNFACTGARPPNVPNYTKTSYANPFNLTALASGANGSTLVGDGRAQTTTPGVGVNPNPPPYFDDGSPLTSTVFAANTAALASGTGATSGGTEGSYPGTGSPAYTNANNTGAVPASTSVAAEGAGTETLVTLSVPNPSPAGQLQTVGSGPALTAGVMPTPNGSHASTLSPTGATTLTSISPTSTASGAGTQLLTCTGTNFTPQSVIYVNGVAQATTFVSATSLTATVNKKATAGTWPVVVITSGAVTTAAQTWTFT